MPIPSAATWNAVGESGPLDSRAGGHAIERLLPDQPDRARQRDHGQVQPGIRARRSQDGGGIGMALIPFLQASRTALWLGLVRSARSVFILIICLVLMLGVAAVILADRKIWAAVQMRRGPNVVGPFGLLQTIADALKFLFKEVIIPAGANKVIFFLAPLVSVMLAFIAWAVIPFNKGWVVADINVGILYLFAVSSLGVYGMVMAGWASNSKYPFLSALRAAAQMVSYEVSIGFVIITVLLFAGSLNLSADRARAGNQPASSPCCTGTSSPSCSPCW